MHVCNIKLVGINVHGTCLISENREHLYPRNIPAIRYHASLVYLWPMCTRMYCLPEYKTAHELLCISLQWMFQESVCPYSAVACTQEAGQDNWIVTQRMQQNNRARIQVLIDYTTNCTTVSPCDSEALELHILRTTDANSNFAAYNLVSMPILNNTPIIIPLTGLADGSYILGIRDNGTCVTLNRVQVYYSVCEVPYSTIEDTGLVFEGNVTVSCVPNTVSASVPTTCSAGGVLSPLTPCECMAGFSGADGMNCVGKTTVEMDINF